MTVRFAGTPIIVEQTLCMSLYTKFSVTDASGKPYDKTTTCMFEVSIRGRMLVSDNQPP